MPHVYDLVHEADIDDDDLHHLIVYDLVTEADICDHDLYQLIVHTTLCMT